MQFNKESNLSRICLSADIDYLMGFVKSFDNYGKFNTSKLRNSINHELTHYADYIKYPSLFTSRTKTIKRSEMVL